MTPLNSTLLIIFGVIIYMMSVDKNISDYLNLIFKIIKLNTERMFWMIKFHPRNPITNLVQNYKMKRLAEQLQKEFDSK